MRPPPPIRTTWARFRAEYLDGDEASYQAAVRRFAGSHPDPARAAAP